MKNHFKLIKVHLNPQMKEKDLKEFLTRPEVNIEGKIIDGHIIDRYDNGNKKIEGNWKLGFRNGLITEWFADGDKKQEGYYKDGQVNGLFTLWDKNGYKRTEQNYKK